MGIEKNYYFGLGVTQKSKSETKAGLRDKECMFTFCQHLIVCFDCLSET